MHRGGKTRGAGRKKTVECDWTVYAAVETYICDHWAEYNDNWATAALKAWSRNAPVIMGGDEKLCYSEALNQVPIDDAKAVVSAKDAFDDGREEDAVRILDGIDDGSGYTEDILDGWRYLEQKSEGKKKGHKTPSRYILESDLGEPFIAYPRGIIGDAVRVAARDLGLGERQTRDIWKKMKRIQHNETRDYVPDPE